MVGLQTKLERVRREDKGESLKELMFSLCSIVDKYITCSLHGKHILENKLGNLQARSLLLDLSSEGEGN